MAAKLNAFSTVDAQKTDLSAEVLGVAHPEFTARMPATQ
jgi:hypothetical protein